MAGGVFQIIGVIAAMVIAAELFVRLFPRRLADEMREIVGDVAGPKPEPEVDQLRKRGAL